MKDLTKCDKERITQKNPPNPKKEESREEMVLYYCPYCGSANLKSLYEIQVRDIWCCAMCKYEMKMA